MDYTSLRVSLLFLKMVSLPRGNLHFTVVDCNYITVAPPLGLADLHETKPRRRVQIKANDSCGHLRSFVKFWRQKTITQQLRAFCTSMATDCLASSLVACSYIKVLWIPRPQKIANACESKQTSVISSGANFNTERVFFMLRGTMQRTRELEKQHNGLTEAFLSVTHSISTSD